MSSGTVGTVERLRHADDIQAVFQGRRRRAGRLVVVHVREREDEGPSRVAVVASRQVGGSVSRNRSKRLLREAARTIDWREGLDVVLVARSSAATAGLDGMCRDLAEQVTELGLDLGGSTA